MKKTNLRHWLTAGLATVLIACLAACGGDGGKETDPATDAPTVTEAPTSPDTPAASETNAPETDPVTEAPTESETLRVLEWESYDAALDNSAVDQKAEHTIDQSQWVVTDGLDRVMSTYTQTGAKDEEKIVAIFYWTWHGDFSNQGQKAYNNQQNIDKLIAMGKTERDYMTLPIGELKKLGIKTEMGPYHFWDEPVYGYYSANDEWVLRKQAELLAAADVDVVFFDNTNGSFTWMQSAKTVMKVFSEARAQGVDAPDCAFMLPFGGNSDARKQLYDLYDQIYSKDYYPDVWFELDGKPMIMAHNSCLDRNNAKDKTIYDFFTFRANNGDYVTGETALNQWGWLSRYPQAYYHNDKNQIEQMTVGVAVNHNYVNGRIAPMSLGENIIGRTWTSRGYDTRENAILYGACFREQWENALQVDPKVVFVTAWNEWVAMRINDWAGMYQNCFVDQYNAEFSRDCEPSTGILKDHYYYQLADYIRQFKGTNPIEAASWEKLIDVNGGYGQWANVTPTYNDYFGLPDRDANGYTDPETGKRFHYTNDTGRNDIYDAKVARDYENIYFMVRTVENLTPYTDAYWMNLYIDMGEVEGGKNWENYEFILNKTNPENETTATLERFTGNGYETEIVGKVTYAVKGNVMTVCIPKTMLGIPAEEMDFEFGFKWTDNTLVDDGDIMKWYVNGDVAPVGRFNYCYSTTGSAEYVPAEKKSSDVLDLTDEATREYLKGAVSDSTVGIDYEFTAEGLKLTSTVAGSDAAFLLDYDKISPAVMAENYDTVVITYKTLNADTKELRLAVASADVKDVVAARARKINLTADGASHTGDLALANLRSTKGYVHKMGFYFAKDAAAGQSILIEKIEFVTEEAAE